jgi:ParB/Sulfiredoxin domain
MNQDLVGRTKIENVDRVDLTMHARHKELPGPDRESPMWLAFVSALSGAGPEGIPPLIVTPDNRIMDGERRWLAARQLGWDQVPVLRRPESEAAVIIVDSLMGQRHLSKGA